MKRCLLAFALSAALLVSCNPSKTEEQDQKVKAVEEPDGGAEPSDEPGEEEGDVEEPVVDDIWTEENPLERSFFLPGFKFYKGCQEELGMPVEAFLKLVAAGGEGKVILPKIESLKGYVKIDSADKALAYVRLFTDLDTHYLFEDSRCIEVRPTDDQETGFGELRRAEFDKFELKDPVVKRDGDRFVVTRAVLDAKGTIYLRTEQVSEDGTCVILKEKEIASDVEDLYYPVYE